MEDLTMNSDVPVTRSRSQTHAASNKQRNHSKQCQQQPISSTAPSTVDESGYSSTYSSPVLSPLEQQQQQRRRTRKYPHIETSSSSSTRTATKPSSSASKENAMSTSSATALLANRKNLSSNRSTSVREVPPLSGHDSSSPKMQLDDFAATVSSASSASSVPTSTASSSITQPVPAAPVMSTRNDAKRSLRLDCDEDIVLVDDASKDIEESTEQLNPAKRPKRDPVEETHLHNAYIMSLAYVDSIYMNSLQREKKYALPHRLPRHFHSKMRTAVIDWLIEVHTNYDTTDAALYNAISIFDRYLTLVEVPKALYQCCGATALWIASKIHDVVPFDIADFVHLCASAYSAEDFVQVERDILKQLDFFLLGVTPVDFLSMFVVVLQLDAKATHLAQYLAMLTRQSAQFYGVRPSLVAAAAVHLAATTLDCGGWNHDHSVIFRLDIAHVNRVAEMLRALAHAKTNPKYLACKRQFDTEEKDFAPSHHVVFKKCT